MLSAEPVCSCALFLLPFARETAGAARTRSSPRPLVVSEGGKYLAKPGRNAPREREHMSLSVSEGWVTQKIARARTGAELNKQAQQCKPNRRV
jgi:hypothetical protein